MYTRHASLSTPGVLLSLFTGLSWGWVTRRLNRGQRLPCRQLGAGGRGLSSCLPAPHKLTVLTAPCRPPGASDPEDQRPPWPASGLTGWRVHRLRFVLGGGYVEA
uniref:Uncharacterized protein n=1 Tax=Rangifer tarandus platyrhynchus TaxID=3082113 RepID=A0ACB0F6G9_RANTA|nr:unnamed protein product [Rangifer tarandus platyrhynchus]